MTASSRKDIEGLKMAGRAVALTLKEMKRRTRPGMTTEELDRIGERMLKKYGAEPAPRKTYGFPGATCISINHEVAHGIPGSRVIQKGDLINIDVSAEWNGYYADTGESFQVPPLDERSALCRHTKKTLHAVLSRLKHGVKLNEIGRQIQLSAKKGGYQVIQNLCSHGIGRALHEEPKHILPIYDPGETSVLHEGLVITVEPFLSTRARMVVEDADGWTLKVPDQSYVAQCEHTIMITRNKPLVFTAV